MNTKLEANLAKISGIEQYNKTNNKNVFKENVTINYTSINKLIVDENLPPNLCDALVEIVSQLNNDKDINLAKERMNNLTNMSLDKSSNKLIREKFINFLILSIKSDDKWKEILANEIFDVYKNFSNKSKDLYKYDCLKLLDILFYLSSEEYNILINLIKISFPVMLILNKKWKLNGKISIDDLPITIRKSLFQNLNEQDKKYFTLNALAGNLIAEYSLLDSGRTYRAFDKYDESYKHLFANALSEKFKNITVIFQFVPSTTNQIKELFNYLVNSGKMIDISKDKNN